ncbi:hypothetical protein ACTSEZ_14745 [Metabacillus sp. JX24]|uniref:hypothetical protein n=1 Tax=Metabacillus sp. JX24 TaxID=3240759 RepID=UPI003510C015
MIKKFIKLNLAIMLTLTAGCGTDSAGKAEKQEYIPETEAFKNEFTREFMKSTEETVDGFYTFESKTKGYTMLFPVNAIISTMDYEQIKTSYEALSYSEDVDEEDISLLYDG